MGKTGACAISTVARFFCEKRVPQIAARVEQVSEWITLWRGFNVDTRRRIRQVWEKKGSHAGTRPRRWNQATGPISATICSVLEAGWKPSTPGFWQANDASATLYGALFRKAQIIESLSKDMETQMWEKAAPAEYGHGESHHHRLCQEGEVSTDQRGKFHGCTCAGFSFLRSHPRTSPACGWIYSQPFFLCSL